MTRPRTKNAQRRGRGCRKRWPGAGAHIALVALLACSSKAGPTVGAAGAVSTGGRTADGGDTRLADAISVSAGHYDSCAALRDGSVWCWGSDMSCILGNCTTTASSTPIVASALTNTAVAVSAGGIHTCALLSGGTVGCWGDRTYDQLGDGSVSIYAMGQAVMPLGVTSAIAVAAGGTHTCALLRDHTVQCWGSNSLGELGNGATSSSGIPMPVLGVTGASAVTASYEQSCALLTDGTVRCWGDNGSGQLGSGTTVSSATPVAALGISTASAVSAGYTHTCAIVNGGVPYCWGSNSNGELGNGTTASSLTPVSTSGVSNATAMAAGDCWSCALLADETVQCWGNNNYGQLGNGTSTAALTPVAVVGISGVSAVSAGGSQTCALLSSGQVQCWGSDGHGQLGSGTFASSPTPVSVVMQ